MAIQQVYNYHVALSPGQALVFGYGSLLLQTSMEATLGQPYRNPRYQCSLRGWRRSWNVFMPNDHYYEPGAVDFVPNNIIYLNIKRSASCSANGLLYVLEPGQVEAFDRREWVYDRQVVTSDLVGLSVGGGEAYVYTGKPAWQLDPMHARRDNTAIRRSYLDILDQGMETLGNTFRFGFVRSTDPLPEHLVFSDVRRNNGQRT